MGGRKSTSCAPMWRWSRFLTTSSKNGNHFSSFLEGGLVYAVLTLGDQLKRILHPLQFDRFWLIFYFIFSRNPLRPVTLEEVELLESSTPDSFPSLEIVVLGSVAYEWEDLVALSHLWPRISQLTVPFNKMAVLSEPPTNILFNITSIDLEKNGINEWTEVLKLNCLNK